MTVNSYVRQGCNLLGHIVGVYLADPLSGEAVHAWIEGLAEVAPEISQATIAIQLSPADA